MEQNEGQENDSTGGMMVLNLTVCEIHVMNFITAQDTWLNKNLHTGLILKVLSSYFCSIIYFYWLHCIAFKVKQCFIFLKQKFLGGFWPGVFWFSSQLL